MVKIIHIFPPTAKKMKHGTGRSNQKSLLTGEPNVRKNVDKIPDRFIYLPSVLKLPVDMFQICFSVQYPVLPRRSKKMPQLPVQSLPVTMSSRGLPRTFEFLEAGRAILSTNTRRHDNNPHYRYVNKTYYVWYSGTKYMYDARVFEYITIIPNRYMCSDRPKAADPFLLPRTIRGPAMQQSPW